MTNSVKHSRPGNGGSVTVVVIDLGAAVRVEVIDDGSDKVPRIASHEAELPDSGRGLRIVNDLARRWGHHSDDFGLTVWFEVCDATDSILALSAGPLMNTSPRRDQAAVHDVSCDWRIRWIRLAEAGDPVSPPAGLLKAIVAEIGSCCGHAPLRAYRLAWGWTVSAAVGALNGLRASDGRGHPGVSRRAWQDWEAGKRPNRHNQDWLCRLFGTGPVELGFARDYREGAGTGSAGRDDR